MKKLLLLLAVVGAFFTTNATAGYWCTGAPNACPTDYYYAYVPDGGSCTVTQLGFFGVRLDVYDASGNLVGGSGGVCHDDFF